MKVHMIRQNTPKMAYTELLLDDDGDVFIWAESST